MQHFCPIAEPSGRVPPRGGTGSRQCLCWTPSSTISSRYHPTLRARKACCCARSSPLQSQKRRLLVCPVLYRNGAPEEIRTPDPQIRSLIGAHFASPCAASISLRDARITPVASAFLVAMSGQPRYISG